MTISLSFYNETHDHLLKDYYIPGPQMRFSATPSEANQYCKSEPNRHAIVILHEDVSIIGYFNLHTDEGVLPYSTNHNAILLRSFSVDAKQQGKGYAKAAIQLLPIFVKEHFPSINEIVLAVNHNNSIAQNLYKKCGYEDLGERTEGRWGELFIMHKKI